MNRLRLAVFIGLVALAAPTPGVSAISSVEGVRLATPRAYHTATRLPDGRILIAGGVNDKNGVLAAAEVLNAAATRVELQLSMGEPRYGHMAVALHDGRVLIAGGMGTGNRALASAELFDPATKTFRSVGSMTVARFRHAAALLSDGSVLVIGGRAGVIVHDSSERFDPLTERFVPDAALPARLFEHTATALPNGNVAVVGGAVAIDSFDAPVLLYDPSLREFRETGGLRVTRHVAAVFADGRLGVFGGMWDSGYIVDPAKPFNPITLEPRAAVYGHTATSLPDGSIVTAAGYLANAFTFSGTVRLWRSTATAPAMTSDLRLARAAHTATVLSDGRLLVVGGNTPSGPTERTEIVSFP